MCIVWRESFSGETWPVFIAGVRPGAMVMKAALTAPRSSARAAARPRVLFVYKPADVFVLACIFMCFEEHVVVHTVSHLHCETRAGPQKRLVCKA